MPPKTFATLILAVLLLAAVSIGIAAMFWTDIAPWLGVAVVALLGLRFALARFWMRSDEGR